MKRHALLLALLSSCGPLVEVPTTPGTMEPLLTADSGTPAVPDAGVEADAGAPPMTGLPCDVRTVIEQRCSGCHGGQTYLRHLLTRDEFLTPRLNSTQLVGQFALQRMQPGVMSPMPPYGYAGGTVSAQELAVMTQWVNAGMPGGACGSATP